MTTAQHPAPDPTAVLGRRAGAYVVDWLVLAAIPIAIFFAVADVQLWERPLTCTQVEGSPRFDASGRTCIDDIDINWDGEDHTAATFRTIAPILAGAFALGYLLIVQWIVQGLTGATLGKAIFGIRTVNERGTGPGLGKQLVRGLLWIVPDGLISCFGIPVVAALTAGLTKGHRRVGDMAAGTYVVRASERGRPVTIPGKGPAPAISPAPSATPAPVEPEAAEPEPAEPRTDQAGADQAGAPAGPQWDSERNAYIQWDPKRGSWVIFDNDAQEWKPLR